MPRKLEMDSLRAEESGLRALLNEALQVDDPVGVLQYSERLTEIKNQLEALGDNPAPMASVALFFSGKPVLGSIGIASDFAGRALKDYQELISKIFAKLELGGMGERGPIPLKQDATLMVTGMAHGSFGFVLTELSDQTELHDTALKETVTATSALLEGVSAVNETSFEQLADDLDSRTLDALRRFFSDLDSEAATIRIVDDVRELQLDSASIHRALMRTEATEIEESSTEAEGVMKGFLPAHRRFEMEGIDGVTYSGSVSQEAAEQMQNVVNSGRPLLGKLCKIGLLTRTVKSVNKPPRLAYRLNNFYTVAD